ncbi:hypothetical protein [Natronomonas gomsonensis]|uniref:hypothetical protein n=1 Tax=Natronomonas gomsonensis TaxID=1046043 RepID=UPI0015BBBCA0|nr:hypothetical protein [Natronomonas gomsonensis]
MDPPLDDRGQLLVVVALLVAATFVALALVLNSAIFAENLSSRETTDSEAATAYAADANRTVAQAATRTADAEVATADGARAVFDGIVDDWARSRSATAAERGASADLQRTAHVGWRLEQAADREYMPESETTTADWTVAEDASNVSTMRFEADTSSLYDATLSFNDTDERAFRVVVDDGTDTWTMYLFREGGTDDRFVVHVGDPSGFDDLTDLLNSSSSCDVVADRAAVDLRDHTLAGNGCPALDFADDLDGPVSIRYENAYNSTLDESRIVGSYDIVVNGTVATNATGHPQNFTAPGGTDPTAQAVVYSVNYRTVYEREEIRNVRNGRYAPREEAYP